MTPTPVQIIAALPHVRYEIESLLLTPSHDATNKGLVESVYFRKMAHGRVLFTFFSTALSHRYQDDILSEDFSFSAQALYGPNPKPLLDSFNKRLFHLTYTRINEKSEWPMDRLLAPVMMQSRRFINHILQYTTNPISSDERDCWRRLNESDSVRVPLQQNTSNVAASHSAIINLPPMRRPL